jgi:hypothetical protein
MLICSLWQNPLSGRISVVVPFLPFSPTEAAVVAHRFVLELKRTVLRSVKMSGKRLVGNIVLELERDGAICKLLADEGYDPDQGARSLQSAVETRIGDALVQAYLEEEGEIDDYLPITKYRVGLSKNGALSVVKIMDAHLSEDASDQSISIGSSNTRPDLISGRENQVAAELPTGFPESVRRPSPANMYMWDDRYRLDNHLRCTEGTYAVNPA